MSHRYSIHGVGTTVHGGAAVLAAVDARLRSFATTEQAGDMRFEFIQTDDPPVDRPPGEMRTVYDPEDGDVVYDERADRLYMTLAEHIRVACDPVAGLVRVTFGQVRDSDLWLLSHPALTLPLVEMLKRRGLYSVHAAGVSVAGRSLLIAGSSGTGKTTLALAMIRAGFGFLGDDMLFVSDSDSGQRVHAFPDEVDVSRETAEFFPELRGVLEQPRADGWPKWSFRVERIYGSGPVWTAGSAGTSVPVAVVFPRIARTRDSRLEPLTADRALLELVPNVLLTEARACQRHLAALARLVDDAACYRLWTGRDFDSLPDLLRPLLD